MNELADRWGVEFGHSTRVWSEFDTGGGPKMDYAL